MTEQDEHSKRFREAAHQMSKDKLEKSPVSPVSPRNQSYYISSYFLISALKICAWVALISGLIGCVWIWSNTNDTGIPKALRAQYTISAITLAVQGSVTWVLFNVVAMMAESLEIIREKISRES